MATINVNGQQLDAPDGAPLVEVLKNNGFYVSNLCYIDGLKPYAGCRSCLVDIEGPPGLSLSCTATVQDGMTVRTDTEEVVEARKAVLAVILANHSDRCLTCHRREHCHPGDICLRDDVVTHRCLTCSKNYRCELQATCEMAGMSGYEPWVGEERSFYQTAQPPADRANPYMEFDPQMCIICTRCQRACEEKRHTSAITLSGKGWTTQIAFGAGGPIDESNCDFSGACIDVCPTAALMEHPNKWVAKPDRWTTTTCDSCAVGCSLMVGSRDGRGVIVRPGAGNDFSGDQICVRGRYHYDSLKPRERLSKHLIRRGNIQAPATFEEAIEAAAAALKAAKNPTVSIGATATLEEAWLARQVAAKLGGAAESDTGPVMRAVNAALEARLGGWKMAAKLNQVPTAKAIVVVADDLEETHNVASVRVKDAAVHEGAKLIVIGSLRSELVDFAAAWIRPDAGDEGHAAAELADAMGGKASKDPDINAAASLLREADRERTVVICAPNPVSPAIAGAMAGGAANIATALFEKDASSHLLVLPPAVNANGLADLGLGATEPKAGAAVLAIRDDLTMRGLDSGNVAVAIDSVLSETAKVASVVLAEGRAYASRGTYLQGDFRAQRLEPAISPEGDARPLYDVLAALARALDIDAPATPADALAAIAKEFPAYQPAADLLVGDGVKLQIAPTSQAKSVPVTTMKASGDGFRIVASRDLYTERDAAALRHAEAEKLHRYDRIQLSEIDAERLKLKTGDEIELAAGRLTLRAPITVTERVAPGSVFVSSLLQGGAIAAFFEGNTIPTAKAGALTPA